MEENKKEKNKKEDGKKGTAKKGFRIIAVIAIIALIIIAVGYPVTLKIIKESSLKEIDNMFVAMKSGDEETIKKYLKEGDSSDEDMDETSQEMAKTMLRNINYEIVSTDVSLKENIVKINVTNKDLKEVFSAYMKKAFSLAFSKAFSEMAEEEMEEQMQNYFEEQYNSEDIETVTTEVTITVKRDSGKWNIEIDKDEFIEAILPGYESIINSINSLQE
jgi:hypothetical protein